MITSPVVERTCNARVTSVPAPPAPSGKAIDRSVVEEVMVLVELVKLVVVNVVNVEVVAVAVVELCVWDVDYFGRQSAKRLSITGTFAETSANINSRSWTPSK